MTSCGMVSGMAASCSTLSFFRAMRAPTKEASPSLCTIGPPQL